MKSYRGYILDMDGVIYRGDEPIKDAVETANTLKDMGCKLVFITNNSSKLPGEYSSILAGMGVTGIREEDIITSGNVAAKYLENELRLHPKRRAVLCVAEDSVKHLLSEIGMEVLDPADYRRADYVVVGFYKLFDWELGSRAASAVATYGAKLIGTNPDPSRPVENGEIEAGTGAIIAFIESASRSKARIVGKPYPEMYRMALQRMSMERSQVLMVGDMLSTDIRGALELGMDAALVLTGISKKEDIERSGITPTFVVETLRELIPYAATSPRRRGNAQGKARLATSCPKRCSQGR